MTCSLIKKLATVAAAGCFMGLYTHCGNTAGVVDNFYELQRIGRPVAGSELLLTRESMHVYNEISASDDNPSNGDPDVAQVFTEMQTVIQAFTTFGASTFGSLQPGYTNYVAGFAPNVLRINTENSFSPSPDITNSEDYGFSHMAYNLDYGFVGGTSLILTGGRKIEDQVFNVSWAYLLAGTTAATTAFFAKQVNGTGVNSGSVQSWSDKLTYGMGSTCVESAQANGPAVPNLAASNSDAAPGHYCLYGQTYRYGTASFPFLASATGTY